MRYIRLNNDVKIKWEILRNTDPEVFTNKDITVKLFSKCGCEQPISYTIVDNKIFIDYFGKDQRETGSYRLCLIENDGKTNMATLDYVDCFTLSKTLKNQTSTGSDSSSSLKTEVIELSSKINTTGVEYVGGDGIDVVGSVISVDETVARTDKLTELEAKIDTKAEKTELPDVSIYNPTDNFKTVNGQSIIGTGDVVIEVPNNLSQLNNDMDYITRSETVDINTYNQHVENQSVENTNFNNNITELQNNKADKTEIPDVSIYNPTNNFKTINGQSIIGQGNIEIQGGGGVSEDKMDKHHPIFTETVGGKEINPDFRLHGYITYSDYYGTFNDNCVERYHDTTEMYIRWDLQAVQNYLNDNADTKYAAVKGFCRADHLSFGNCKYLLFIENTETGTSERIDQYLSDTHVYGAIGESNNITSSSYGIADSRDTNDIISAIINNAIGESGAYYVKNDVRYNCPFQMYQCDTAFNTNMSIPYMTTLIDIKGIINNYNISDYNRLTVKIFTEDTTHWHIMSSNLFFTNDTDFVHDSETTKEYVLIDELNKKAEKDNLKTINGQSIIGTGNIDIQGGSGDITANGDNNFYGNNTFHNNLNTFGGITITDPRYSERKNSIFDILTQDYSYDSSTQFTITKDSVYESGKKIVWSEQDNRYTIVSDTNYNIRQISLYTTLNYVSGITNDYEAFWWNGETTGEGQKIFTKIEYNTSPSNVYVYEIFINLPADFTENVFLDCSCNYILTSYIESNGFIKDAPFDGNQYVRQSGNWTLVQGGSGDITANGDNIFNGTNTFNNPVYIYNSLYCTDPRDSNYTNYIFNVLSDGHTNQIQTYNNMDSVYESGKKFVWSEEQNKVIIVEDANYNIKYCNSVYNTINYVYDVTNGYEAFWWNGQHAENGVDKIIKKVVINTSPSNEYVHEFYVNVSVDYTQDVNVYYYYEAQFPSYLEGNGFIKDAPFDGNQYVRQSGNWTLVQGGSSAVTSVNGATGDVVIEVPTNVSQLNNDAGYLTAHQDLSNYATKTELSEYNKTENFKTINGQSIIGTGNIEIQGGGGSEDKMNKHHPIFNETYAVDEIKPEFRLSGYIDKIETQGTTNNNCVERWHSTDNLWVRWSLENINTYLTNNPNTKYAAVKGLCLPSSAHLGECEYHLFIENTSTGLSEQIDQYMQDRHVYGDYYESKNITLYDGAIVDSRDPNDNIIGALNQAIGSTTTTCRFVRNGVTYYTPDSMSSTNVFFNDNYTLPYMTSIIDIKGILEHYSLDTYTSLRVQLKTTQLTHWHIMSCYLFFSNDTEFMKHSETSVDYVLIDELTQKATKNDLNDYNKTNNFKTINNQSIIGTGNIEIQGGSSAVTSVNGQTGDVVINIPVTSVNGATGDVTIDVPTVPTNVSAFTNDAGYLTQHQDLSSYATAEFVNNATNNGNIVWTGTQAEYDALSDKTVYLIYLIKK